MSGVRFFVGAPNYATFIVENDVVMINNSMNIRKLTKAEAGKLGAAKSRITSAANKAIRVTEYDKNPTQCKNCDAIMLYESRNKKFCDNSCAAKFNNTKRIRKQVVWQCLHCNKEHNTFGWKIGTYCNAACYQDHYYQQRIDAWLIDSKEGLREYGVPGWIRRYLIETRGYQCEHCNISEWDDKEIVLECDHIDGDSDNANKKNLRLLCPNCHSQTPTYRNKLRDNGLKTDRRNIRRRRKYHEKLN